MTVSVESSDSFKFRTGDGRRIESFCGRRIGLMAKSLSLVVGLLGPGGAVDVRLEL